MARIAADPAHGAAWVTGASSGIGAALAYELARRGWRVAATARGADALAKAAGAHERILAVPADVSDLAAMRAAHAMIEDRLGPVGLMVNNAGIYLPIDGRKPEAAVYAKTFTVNLMGAANALELVVPGMVARGMGHVHFVSSATGFGGMPTASAYGASKAALINMAECLKIELDRTGVGVSLSTPGFVETPAQDDNAFPKPFMVSPQTAARRIVEGVMLGGFETTFPRRFTWILKALYALPKPLYLPIVRARTGWGSKAEPPNPSRTAAAATPDPVKTPA